MKPKRKAASDSTVALAKTMAWAFSGKRPKGRPDIYGKTVEQWTGMLSIIDDFCRDLSKTNAKKRTRKQT